MVIARLVVSSRVVLPLLSRRLFSATDLSKLQKSTHWQVDKKRQRRLEAVLRREGRAEHEMISSAPTSCLLCIHSGNGTQQDQDLLLHLLKPFDSAVHVYAAPGAPYAFARFSSTDSAAVAIASLSRTWASSSAGRARTILFEHSKLLPQESMLLRTMNNTATVASTSLSIPGLILRPEFISPEEERLLVSHFETREWTRLAQRRVQHYGYQFLYQSNRVDSSQAAAEPIPTICLDLLRRVGSVLNQGCFDADQLTVSEYLPGEGIAPHIETHSSFEEQLVVISLLSPTVMELKLPSGVTANTSTTPVTLSSSLWLPPRSLLVLQGEARYLWAHGIAPRKTDIVAAPVEHGVNSPGETFHPKWLSDRRRRMSLTFRRIRRGPCRCPYPTVCDSRLPHAAKSAALPQADSTQPPTTSYSTATPTTVELNHVYNLYEAIGDHFSNTRHKPWPAVERFVDESNPGDVVADIGCGNGRHMGLNRLTYSVGFDRAASLLSVCANRGHAVNAADVLSLPLRSGTVDRVLFVAVLHHLSSVALRQRALMEVVRVLRPGGSAFVSVWSLDQQHKYIDGQTQDVYIPWHYRGSQESVTKTVRAVGSVHHRFYHLFRQGELEDLINTLPVTGADTAVTVVESYKDHNNWNVVFRKAV